MKPMKSFDPSVPAMVDDRLNDRISEWSPSWQGAYEKDATEVEPGVISLDGLLLDGWRAVIVEAGSARHPTARRYVGLPLAKPNGVVSFLAKLWRPL
jgi:hypothetical protein